jgi:acyl-CoA synthetase (AMP-forming)/AMP-acid ligase II
MYGGFIRLAVLLCAGTTGLPKAAVISHVRAYLMSGGLFILNGLKPEDRVYTTMPLYHSAAGTVGAGFCVLQGATMILRDKYDIVKHIAAQEALY